MTPELIQRVATVLGKLDMAEMMVKYKKIDSLDELGKEACLLIRGELRDFMREHVIPIFMDDFKIIREFKKDEELREILHAVERQFDRAYNHFDTNSHKHAVDGYRCYMRAIQAIHAAKTRLQKLEPVESR